MDLFDEKSVSEGSARTAPLAARMRPKRIEDVVGQDHILGEGKLLRRAIEADRLSSVILFGPPGSGKTSIAEVIALVTKRVFVRTSGVLANVETLRTLLREAHLRQSGSGRQTILFIDEIHRFNKAQQDVLLPDLEAGTVTLIGATTHNPFFFLTSPLLSRSLVCQLEPLSGESIRTILVRAVSDKTGLGPLKIKVEEDALAHLAAVCDGDARRALNALETAALTTPPDAQGLIRVTRQVSEESIQKKAVVYDHDEDGHYDTASAFIKSVRGSDPDAALYWLAKMLYAGEDPRFVARRLVILASEDIGNADPRALSVAVSAMHAVEFVGMPEARITLAQAVTYLATAPKSNAAYKGLEKAAKDVEGGRTLQVPRHLRDANYAGAEKLGHTGYKYAHDYAGHFVDQEYMPSEIVYYEPTNEGYEEVIGKRMRQLREIRRQGRQESENKLRHKPDEKAEGK